MLENTGFRQGLSDLQKELVEMLHSPHPSCTTRASSSSKSGVNFAAAFIYSILSILI